MQDPYLWASIVLWMLVGMVGWYHAIRATRGKFVLFDAPADIVMLLFCMVCIGPFMVVVVYLLKRDNDSSPET